MAKLVIFLAVLVFATDITSADVSYSKCTVKEVQKLTTCIGSFTDATRGIANKDNCNLTVAMCTAANTSATCQSALLLSGKCWDEHETKLNDQLKNMKLSCTIDDINDKCPGVDLRPHPCKVPDLRKMDNCFTKFTDKGCDMDKSCKPAEDTADCLNRLYIKKECRAVLPDYVNAYLTNNNFTCNATDIENKCPKAKFNTSSDVWYSNCTQKEVQQLTKCIGSFSNATREIANKDNCNLTDVMCKAADTSATCQSALLLSGKCWDEHETKLNAHLDNMNLSCTIDDIKDKCPKVDLRPHPCKVPDLRKMDKCFDKFTDEGCKVDTSCKPAEDTADCLNKLDIQQECRAKLPDYENAYISNNNWNCTTTVIVQKCPKAKLETTSSASSAMFSFVCLLLSILAGIRYIT